MAPVDPAIPGYTPPDMICAGDGVPDPAGDAYCKGLNSQGRCVPGKANGFFLEPALCSKFPDKDGDSVGDACDNCPDTPNHQLNLTGVSPGTLNGQPNCNLLAEVAGGMPYPYIGDACDPSPCNRPDRHPSVAHGGLYPGDWVDDGNHGDLWRIISYDPQILPDSYAASFRSPETSFKNKYTPGGTPVARVGARVCDCGADPNTGLLRNAWQCHKAGLCQINPRRYDHELPPPCQWRVVKTYKETSTDLQASPLTPPKHPGPPDFGLDGVKGEVSPLALEAAAGTTPTPTGSNPDNLSPFPGLSDLRGLGSHGERSDRAGYPRLRPARRVLDRSARRHHVAGVVLRPSADKVKVIGAFLRKGVLAVEPTLGATALTLPLISDSGARGRSCCRRARTRRRADRSPALRPGSGYGDRAAAGRAPA